MYKPTIFSFLLPEVPNEKIEFLHIFYFVTTSTKPFKTLMIKENPQYIDWAHLCLIRYSMYVTTLTDGINDFAASTTS